MKTTICKIDGHRIPKYMTVEQAVCFGLIQEGSIIQIETIEHVPDKADFCDHVDTNEKAIKGNIADIVIRALMRHKSEKNAAIAFVFHITGWSKEESRDFIEANYEGDE